MASWTEEEMDVRMGRVLRWGVLLAALVMVAGAVVFLLHSARTVPITERSGPATRRFRACEAFLARRAGGMEAE